MSIKSHMFFLGLAASVLLASCSKDNNKSLSELKGEQKEAISTFQREKSISVLDRKNNDLPEITDPSKYYRLKNGLYIKVLDKGNVQKLAVVDKTTVFVQMKGYQFSLNKPRTREFDNLSQANIPELEFKYIDRYEVGAIHYNLVSNVRPVMNYDALMCEGIAFPLSLGLGDGARVSLIIPFDIGPSSSFSSGTTTYIEELRYTFR